ncbi:MAG: AAA family ATPase, partial [Archaeoglobaceae archaeon]
NIHQLGEVLERSKSISEDVKQKTEKIEPAIDPDLLRKYIAYAKNFYPVLSEEAKRRIEEYYISLRAKAKENSPIPITARQLESIVRLAEASARIRLSEVVTAEDVERVIKIMEKSLAQIAIDPETGELDIDFAFSGTSKRQRDRIWIMKKIIEELEEMNEFGAPEEEIIKRAKSNGIEEERAREIISKLKINGEIFSPKFGFYRIVRKR